MNRLHYFDGHNIQETCDFLGCVEADCQLFELKEGGYILGFEEVILTPGSAIRIVHDKIEGEIYDFFILTGVIKT